MTTDAAMEKAFNSNDLAALQDVLQDITPEDRIRLFAGIRQMQQRGRTRYEVTQLPGTDSVTLKLKDNDKVITISHVLTDPVVQIENRKPTTENPKPETKPESNVNTEAQIANYLEGLEPFTQFRMALENTVNEIEKGSEPGPWSDAAVSVLSNASLPERIKFFTDIQALQKNDPLITWRLSSVEGSADSFIFVNKDTGKALLFENVQTEPVLTFKSIDKKKDEGDPKQQQAQEQSEEVEAKADYKVASQFHSELVELYSKLAGIYEAPASETAIEAMRNELAAKFLALTPEQRGHLWWAYKGHQFNSLAVAMSVELEHDNLEHVRFGVRFRDGTKIQFDASKPVAEALLIIRNEQQKKKENVNEKPVNEEAEQQKKMDEEKKEDSPSDLEVAKQRFGDSLEIRDPESLAVQKHLKELRLVPDRLAMDLGRRGLRIVLSNSDVPGMWKDPQRFRAAPRGWNQPTWKGVNGVYDSVDNIMYAGGGETGSESLVLHEFGHAFGNLRKLDDLPVVIEAHKRLYPKLVTYLQQDGPGGEAGRHEFFADSFCDYYKLDKEKFIKRYDAEWHSFLELALTQ